MGNSQVFCHRLPALTTAAVSTVAFGLALASGTSCHFVEVTSSNGLITENFDTTVDGLLYGDSLGVLCETELFIRDGDTMWELSRVFTIISWIIGGLAVLVAWAVSLVWAPTETNWKMLSVMTALAALLQVPIFLIFEADPCSIADHVCGVDIGCFLLIASTVFWIGVTVLTQCVDPPLWAVELDAWRVHTKERAFGDESEALADDMDDIHGGRRSIKQRGMRVAQMRKENSANNTEEEEWEDVEPRDVERMVPPDGSVLYAPSTDSRLMLHVGPNGKRPGDDAKSIASFGSLNSHLKLAEEERQKEWSLGESTGSLTSIRLLRYNDDGTLASANQSDDELLPIRVESPAPAVFEPSMVMAVQKERPASERQVAKEDYGIPGYADYEEEDHVVAARSAMPGSVPAAGVPQKLDNNKGSGKNLMVAAGLASLKQFLRRDSSSIPVSKRREYANLESDSEATPSVAAPLTDDEHSQSAISEDTSVDEHAGLQLVLPPMMSPEEEDEEAARLERALVPYIVHDDQVVEPSNQEMASAMSQEAVPVTSQEVVPVTSQEVVPATSQEVVPSSHDAPVAEENDEPEPVYYSSGSEDSSDCQVDTTFETEMNPEEVAAAALAAAIPVKEMRRRSSSVGSGRRRRRSRRSRSCASSRSRTSLLDLTIDEETDQELEAMNRSDEISESQGKTSASRDMAASVVSTSDFRSRGEAPSSVSSYSSVARMLRSVTPTDNIPSRLPNEISLDYETYEQLQGKMNTDDEEDALYYAKQKRSRSVSLPRSSARISPSPTPPLSWKEERLLRSGVHVVSDDDDSSGHASRSSQFSRTRDARIRRLQMQSLSQQNRRRSRTLDPPSPAKRRNFAPNRDWEMVAHELDEASV